MNRWPIPPDPNVIYKFCIIIFISECNKPTYNHIGYIKLVDDKIEINDLSLEKCITYNIKDEVLSVLQPLEMEFASEILKKIKSFLINKNDISEFVNFLSGDLSLIDSALIKLFNISYLNNFEEFLKLQNNDIQIINDVKESWYNLILNKCGECVSNIDNEIKNTTDTSIISELNNIKEVLGKIPSESLNILNSIKSHKELIDSWPLLLKPSPIEG
tara:strand:- start:2629 stop:3276 length:648 start_codon:yes stop_codon:yes gene_type:complete